MKRDKKAAQKNKAEPSLAAPKSREVVFWETCAAHPYLTALVLCLFLNGFTLGAMSNIPNNAVYLVALCLPLVTAYCVYRLFREGILDRTKAWAAGGLIVLAELIMTKLYSTSEHPQHIVLILCECIVLAICLLMRFSSLRGQIRTFAVFGLSFVLKFYYILYTSCYTRQHDFGVFHGTGEGDGGHTGYIEYLLYNHHLTDFNVMDHSQYYHPPLHHALCAVWIHINENILGVGFDQARESLQTLSLFYSMCIIITAYRILRYFKLEGAALYAPFLIVAFHPCFILLSGQLNNDVLSIAFMMGAVLCTLYWYRERTLKNILKIALCVGLGMMTKISAGLVAPPIALVFLIVFIRDFKQDVWKLVRQFVIFGCVCIPLGLWFGIRNFIKWRVPLTYVVRLPEGLLQYIGEQDYGKRITDFSLYQFESVFENWLAIDEAGNRVSYNEFNPLVTLLKNSLFGEFIHADSFAEGSWGVGFSFLLFWIAVLVAALAVVSLVIVCCSHAGKTGAAPTEKALFASFYVLQMVSFYKMAADYPFTCTMNFRYITPTVIIGALFLGMLVRQLGEHHPKAARPAAVTATALSGAFALCSMVVYVELGG
ncbi:MAG: glycosyltransferase family 39 protein [Oscillospiraceae bacterium]|nr:glycosyltransferase family 39 protein [Oscillospiraceae bacterium]